MKRYLSVFLVFLTLCMLLLSSCGRHDAELAAEALLERCIACDPEAVAAVMGYDVLTLTDIERYTLTRMTFRIVESEQLDSKRRDVTFDTNLFDIMALLNEALVQTFLMEDGETFDSNLWILQQLNTETAARANFRAVLPMILGDDGSWTVDTARIGDDVRDALSGGAYSWYAVYKETFETDAESAIGDQLIPEV